MYESQTLEKIKNDILSKITGVEKREGSFTADMITPIAMELEGAYNQLDVLLSTMFLGDIAGEMLDRRCSEYGITRKPGTKAEGQVKFIGEPGAIIFKGSLVSTNSNMLFETVEDKTIPFDGDSATVPVLSTEKGSKYNVSVGSIVNIPVSINGVISVENIAQTHGGTDIETDKALLSRLLYRLRTPATSGNPSHYKMWALEVDGVGDVKVFPTYYGNGTVLVLPITAEKQAPRETIINKVASHIESVRPIGATVTVKAPTTTEINVTAALILDGTRTIQDVKKDYEQLFIKYITDSVFKIYVVDFYKCLSLFYDVPGVKAVQDFKLNDGTVNIQIDELAIQTVGTIDIKEVE